MRPLRIPSKDGIFRTRRDGPRFRREASSAVVEDRRTSQGPSVYREARFGKEEQCPRVSRVFLRWPSLKVSPFGLVSMVPSTSLVARTTVSRARGGARPCPGGSPTDRANPLLHSFPGSASTTGRTSKISLVKSETVPSLTSTVVTPPSGEFFHLHLLKRSSRH